MKNDSIFKSQDFCCQLPPFHLHVLQQESTGKLSQQPGCTSLVPECPQQDGRPPSLCVSHHGKPNPVRLLEGGLTCPTSIPALLRQTRKVTVRGSLLFKHTGNKSGSSVSGCLEAFKHSGSISCLQRKITKSHRDRPDNPPLASSALPGGRVCDAGEPPSPYTVVPPSEMEKAESGPSSRTSGQPSRLSPLE